MAYRSELEARLARKTTKAIVDYQMIEDGDRLRIILAKAQPDEVVLREIGPVEKAGKPQHEQQRHADGPEHDR